MGGKPDVDQPVSVPVMRPSGTIEEQQRRRAEALRAAEGMWKGRTDIPLDGVEYQQQIRSEWH